jgi:hypothetical protein
MPGGLSTTTSLEGYATTDCVSVAVNNAVIKTVVVKREETLDVY